MTLAWAPAIPWGISIDEGRDAWHAGHLNDAIGLPDGTALVASDSGGGWIVTRDGNATALGDTWDDPDATCLGIGPDGPWHVYSATTQGLRESRSAGRLDLRTIPFPGGYVRALAGTAGSRRLFAASTNGLRMSRVPAMPHRANYAWTAVTLTPTTTSAVTSVSTRATGGSWSVESRLTAAGLNSANTAALRRTALVCRSAVHRDVFWVAHDGTVWTAFSHLTTGPGFDPWQSYAVTGAGVADASSGIGAVSRNQDHIDLFWVASDGSVQSTWWDASVAGGWTNHQFALSPAGFAVASGGVAAAARNPLQVDIFWISSDGSIWTSWWSAATSTWSGHAYRIVAPGSAGPGSAISVVSPHADRLDVVWIAPDGSVKHTMWDSTRGVAWPAPSTLSPPAATAAHLDCAARTQTHLDAFWSTSDGAVWTSWRDDADPAGWAGHAYQIAPPGRCAADSAMTVVSRNGIHLDAMWTDPADALATTWWDAIGGSNLHRNIYSPLGGHHRIAHLVAPHEDGLWALCSGAGGDLAFARWCADDVEVVAATQDGRIFHGVVAAADTTATLTECSVSGLPASARRSRTSVALSRHTAAGYGVMAKGGGQEEDPNFLAFLTSTDGRTWAAVDPPTDVTGPASVMLSAATGGQGEDYNNCVDASPTDPHRAVLGWQTSVFSTTDGGQTMTAWDRDDNPYSVHLHRDVHRVRFDPTDRTAATILVASDGGLVGTTDGGTTLSSTYNKRLANLQCYTTDASGRDSVGSLGVGSEVVGLVTSGLQDNGNVWSVGGNEWRVFAPGDGGLSLLTRQRQVLHTISLSTDPQPVNRAEWDDASHSVVDRGAVPITVLGPGDSNGDAGLLNGFANIVNDPVDMDVFGAKIYAIGFRNNELFGLWNPTGVTTWRWEFYASLPLNAGESISAVGSGNGQQVIAGTSAGRFFRALHGGTVTPLANNAFEAPFGVNYVCVLSDTDAFALYNDWRGGTSRGKILRLVSGSWQEVPRTLPGGAAIPDERCWAIEADWTVSPRTVFTCTDTSVYRSTDDARTWTEQSGGLPHRAHLADLALRVNADGSKQLFMSTWGRSVWVTPI